MNLVIAIDGPAGAGKSTLAKLLAKELKYKYLDTGAMYRAVTWVALEKGIDIKNTNKLTELANQINIKFLTPDKKGVSPILVNGTEITKEIRKPLVNKNVSYVARVKGVREAMVRIQRRFAKAGGIIIDGRDIGSRVVPDADFKFFVTASLEERARRRYNELKDNNINITMDEVKKEIALRDKIDSEREISPLIKTEDAILIDTTNLSIDEALRRVLNYIKGMI